ncbi:MAG: DUF4013 domain-containing protein [Anaerolineaceae bacterium]|nr:DUF4013 domain-containing protein [Anaerolineaceae bacterium]
MKYSRAFSYVFEDKDWLTKILIAGLISLIPVVGQFYLFGWMIEIMRRVKAGRQDILPTTHFSYFLTIGLKMFVVCLIYAIPLIIITFVISLLSTRYKTYDGNSFTIVVSSMGFFGNLITLLVQICVAFLSTYGTIKLAQTDQIRSCLDFKDAFNTIKDNLALFIIVELLMIVAGIIGSAGAILCIIGVIFTAPYGMAINGHLLGQLWANLAASGTDNKPFKGSTNDRVENVVQEAPFTRVEDIENTVVPEEPAAQPIITPVAAVNEIENKTEEISDVTAEAETKAADSADAADSAVSPDNNEEKTEEKNNDIPSFE